MALYDHERRMAQDYINEPPSTAESAFRWIPAAAFILVVGFLLILFVAAPSQDPTGGITHSAPPTTSTAPATK